MAAIIVLATRLSRSAACRQPQRLSKSIPIVTSHGLLRSCLTSRCSYSTESQQTPSPKSPAKKSPAKKSPTKKSPTEKYPAKKSPAKKSPAPDFQSKNYESAIRTCKWLKKTLLLPDVDVETLRSNLTQLEVRYLDLAPQWRAALCAKYDIGRTLLDWLYEKHKDDFGPLARLSFAKPFVAVLYLHGLESEIWSLIESEPPASAAAIDRGLLGRELKYHFLWRGSTVAGLIGVQLVEGKPDRKADKALETIGRVSRTIRVKAKSRSRSVRDSWQILIYHETLLIKLQYGVWDQTDPRLLDDYFGVAHTHEVVPFAVELRRSIAWLYHPLRPGPLQFLKCIRTFQEAEGGVPDPYYGLHDGRRLLMRQHCKRASDLLRIDGRPEDASYMDGPVTQMYAPLEQPVDPAEDLSQHSRRNNSSQQLP